LRLEQIVASTCRQKILLALSKEKRICITALVRTINSTYNQVNRNVQVLENEGIVKTTRTGQMRMIQLHLENPKTQMLLKSLRLLSGFET
jgi:predicted transcriptional regulator